MSERIWRVRIRWLDAHPATYHGPFTRQQAQEFAYTTFAKEQQNLFDITVTRGDFGGEYAPDPVEARPLAEQEAA